MCTEIMTLFKTSGKKSKFNHFQCQSIPLSILAHLNLFINHIPANELFKYDFREALKR